MTFYYISNTID